VSIVHLSRSSLVSSLNVRDLTDPAQGPHALQLLLDEGLAALRRRWRVEPTLERALPLVSVADNYDHLGYPSCEAARDARYTRYVSDDILLRTQTSAMIPPLLRRLARGAISDHLLVCPGLVYRRDSIDRLHTGEPHQVDLWRVRRGAPLGRGDLLEMIGSLAQAMLPGRSWRVIDAEHPYTEQGLQIEVSEGASWVEIGECGLASPALLARCGIPVPGVSGLAMGLGLDRLLMLRKGLDDIRWLRAAEARVQAQMLDLDPWRPVSLMPPVRRDLSLACEPEADAEALGDQVRSALEEEASLVESVEVLSETEGARLPPAARERIGLLDGQKNVLLRVTLRALDRTLTDEESNRLRNRIYTALHRGTVLPMATSRS
jgi:phenylalanyl-tRNA synthetase alpha chain